MELFALTQKGQIVSRSVNGTNDPNNKDFAKWRVLYSLRKLHYADKDKLVANCGITPAACSLAISDLKRHGYVVDTGSTSEV